MSFVRPAAAATLTRWREVLIGLALVALGLFWTFRTVGILQWVGPVVLLAGVCVAWIGWRRARFRRGEDGSGVVEVVEGRITYLGPLNGGTISIDDIDQILLDGDQFPVHWRLEQSWQPPLYIPINAKGAHALFDAFSSLPGLQTQEMLAAMEAERNGPVVIWRRDPNAQAARSLPG